MNSFALRRQIEAIKTAKNRQTFMATLGINKSLLRLLIRHILNIILLQVHNTFWRLKMNDDLTLRSWHKNKLTAPSQRDRKGNSLKKESKSSTKKAQNPITTQ